jgi:Flp pilus assembly protein TadD
MLRKEAATMFWRMMTVLLVAAPAWAQGSQPASAVPHPEQVMALPPELHSEFRQQVLDLGGSQSRRLQLIADFMFDESGLGLTYRHDATHTVEEAYRTRMANCLTFTLVAVALAREAGLEAYGQAIEDTLSFHQEGSMVYRTNHVNAVVVVHHRRFSIDVARDAVMARHVPEPVSDARLLALYYNNRAAELSGRGEHAQAEPFMEISLQLDRGYATSWSNAGVLRMRSGDLGSAERHYLHALTLDPAHEATLLNLSALLERKGDTAGASELKKRVASIQGKDPFHHFQRAVELENLGDVVRAVRHYRRAIALHGTEHRFHSGLARAQMRLGRHRAAERALVRAHELSDGDEQGQYEAKLEQLRMAMR